MREFNIQLAAHDLFLRHTLLKPPGEPYRFDTQIYFAEQKILGDIILIKRYCLVETLDDALTIRQKNKEIRYMAIDVFLRLQKTSTQELAVAIDVQKTQNTAGVELCDSKQAVVAEVAGAAAATGASGAPLAVGASGLATVVGASGSATAVGASGSATAVGASGSATAIDASGTVTAAGVGGAAAVAAGAVVSASVLPAAAPSEIQALIHGFSLFIEEAIAANRDKLIVQHSFFVINGSHAGRVKNLLIFIVEKMGLDQEQLLLTFHLLMLYSNRPSASPFIPDYLHEYNFYCLLIMSSMVAHKYLTDHCLPKKINNRMIANIVRDEINNINKAEADFLFAIGFEMSFEENQLIEYDSLLKSKASSADPVSILPRVFHSHAKIAAEIKGQFEALSSWITPDFVSLVSEYGMFGSRLPVEPLPSIAMVKRLTGVTMKGVPNRAVSPDNDGAMLHCLSLRR